MCGLQCLESKVVRANTVNFNQKSRKTNTNCRNDFGEMIALNLLEIRHDPSEVMPLPPVGTPRFGRRFMGRLRLRVRNAATFAPLPAVKTALARGIARSLEVGKF